MREQGRIFALANNHRLSENSKKNSPRFLLELSLTQEALVLSEEQSCSAEEVSLKRELAEPHSIHCSSSRPGKNA